MTCAVPGCEKPALRRVWCGVHYRRWLRTGNPTLTYRAAPGATADERLRHHGWTVTESDCWEWAGHRTGRGYGRIGVSGRLMYSHRLAYEAWVGPIPDGMHVLHRCDNPPCINPAHLFLGTDAENVRDRDGKGRTARGAATRTNTVINIDIARTMREEAATMTVGAIAEKHGVKRELARRAILNITWQEEEV